MRQKILKALGIMTVLAVSGMSLTCSLDSSEHKTILSPSSAKELTGFLISDPLSTGTFIGSSILVTVPYGTDVTALVAFFWATGVRVKIGNTVQTSAVTVNDFTNPLTYTVVAADNTTKDYMVAVIAAGVSEKGLESFYFTDPAVMGFFSVTNITVNVPYGTDVTALVANFCTSGVRVSVGGALQISGKTANDFSDPVIYRVTAFDNSFQDYAVTVKVSAISDKNLLGFYFPEPLAAGIFNGNKVEVIVPNGTDVTALVATFFTNGFDVRVGTIQQISGRTANDFTDPVFYRVFAADGTSQYYKVTVKDSP